MRKILGLFLCSIPFQLSAQNDTFNIIFKHDFENNEIGYYETEVWNADWFHPGWRDSDHRKAGYEDNTVDIIFDQQSESKVMKFEYPKGALGPQEGGDYWNSYWGSSEQEVYFSYNVKFKPGFDFNKGGKLPGINGGPMYEGATQPTTEQGFSSILMFHPEGRIIFYLYHQDNTAERYADVKRWGDFQFDVTQERWYNITLRVVVNTFTDTVANYNGLLEGYIDGKLIGKWENLRLLNSPNVGRGVEGMIMASFFGGSTDDMAALRDEWAYFDDFYLFTYGEGVEVPRGNTPSPSGRVLTLPNLKNRENFVPDETPPSVPLGLTAQNITGSSVKLTWNPSSDNVAVNGYHVYVNGARNSTVFTTSKTITGLNPGTEYTFEVAAFDPSSNESSRSASIKVTTLEPDTSPPSTPAGLKADNIGENQVSLSWNSSSDNVGVTAYRIYANGLQKGSTPNTSYNLDQLNPGISYDITITAVDAAANESPHSSTLTITTLKKDDDQADSDMPDVSIIKVINSEQSTETVSSVKSLGTAEVEGLGVRVSEYDDFSGDVELFSATDEDYIVNNSGRTTRNLQVLYNFSTGKGNKVMDISGNEDPVDLQIMNPSSVKWLAGQGLKVTANTLISSIEPPRRLMDSLSLTNQITVEAWVKPGMVNQAGPARIVTLSADHFRRAFTLGQEGTETHYDYIFRLNTANTDANGVPEGKTAVRNGNPGLDHVVYTKNSAGNEAIYLNGIKQYSGNRTGKFTSWESNFIFALANEITGERSWLGSYYLVAVYNSALSREEILQNYNAGYGQIEFTTRFEGLIPNTSYFLSPFVKTDKGIKYGDAINILTPLKKIPLDYDTLNMSMYPNPSNGTFTVFFEYTIMDLEDAWLRIIDSYGRLILLKDLFLSDVFYRKEEQISLDPAKTPNGLYFVTLNIGKNSVTQKLMVYR